MAATQQQRAHLYNKLTETMDNDAADTLMGELPPGGWEQMATKDDLAATEARLTTLITTSLAQLDIKITEGLAHAERERAEIMWKQGELAERQGERHAGQVRYLFVVGATILAAIIAATISIWFELRAIG